MPQAPRAIHFSMAYCESSAMIVVASSQEIGLQHVALTRTSGVCSRSAVGRRAVGFQAQRAAANGVIALAVHRGLAVGDHHRWCSSPLWRTTLCMLGLTHLPLAGLIRIVLVEGVLVGLAGPPSAAEGQR